MMSLYVITFCTIFSPVAPLLNVKCMKWMYNDGSDCSSYLPELNLVPVPELLSHEYKCPDGTVFKNSKGTPWECHQFNPDCLDVIKPEFRLYTPDTNDTAQKFVYTTDYTASIKKWKLDTKKHLYVIVHGFGSHDYAPGQDWMVIMKDALIANGDNAIIVKWLGGSGGLLKLDGSYYLRAAANTQSIGKGIANVVNAMVTQKKAILSTTTIVGFSLGAHVAGYAGSGIKGLSRIIGLDPAGPMFTCAHPDARLDASDAEFVEVIHTNGDTFTMGGAGTLQRLGHVDIYPNGGWLQPGCSRAVPSLTASILNPRIIINILTLDYSMMADDASCNHGRAPKFFIESIKNAGKKDKTCGYTSFFCESGDKFDKGECFNCTKDGCLTAGYLLKKDNVKFEDEEDDDNQKDDKEKDDKEKEDKEKEDKEKDKEKEDKEKDGKEKDGKEKDGKEKDEKEKEEKDKGDKDKEDKDKTKDDKKKDDKKKDDKNKDKKVTQGKYYFKTHARPEYCGTQYKITLTSNAEAYGGILLELSDKTLTSLHNFQLEADTLYSKTPKSVIAVLPFEMGPIVKARLTYTRYNSWGSWVLFSSGTKQFTLTAASIRDTSGKVKKMKNSVTVKHSEGVDITFS